MPLSRSGERSGPRWRRRAGEPGYSPTRTRTGSGPAAPSSPAASTGASGRRSASHGRPRHFRYRSCGSLGLDPASERARRVVELIGANSRWDHAGQPYWEGEVEECINGRTIADGAYFGVDVSSIVDRLVGERLEDGGWNCERANGSVRSSFASTVNVLEGLLEYERATGGTPESQEARKSGEDYLLERSLFRRLSTGEVADERFLSFMHPNRWRYDVLRALDYFRSAAALTGAAPDPRLGEAVDHVRSRRLEDGTWPLDSSLPGRVWFDVNDGQGKPSRWVTLRAMRVLRWWEKGCENR